LSSKRIVDRPASESVRYGDCDDARLELPSGCLTHHVGLVVVPTRRKHRNLFNERLGPRGVSVGVPISRLPFRRGSEHARCLAALRTDFDYTGDIDLEALCDRRSVGFVLTSGVTKCSGLVHAEIFAEQSKTDGEAVLYRSDVCGESI